MIPTLIQRFQVQEALQALGLDPDICIRVTLEAPDRVHMLYYLQDDDGSKYLDEFGKVATAERVIPVVD